MTEIEEHNLNRALNKEVDRALFGVTPGVIGFMEMGIGTGLKLVAPLLPSERIKKMVSSTGDVLTVAGVVMLGAGVINIADSFRQALKMSRRLSEINSTK